MQLTLRQVAELFSVSENTIARWVNEENLPAHDIKSQYRFDRAELLEWAATRHRLFSPTIFENYQDNHLVKVSVSEAIERGGVAFQVAGHDRYEVLRSAIADLQIPPPLDHDALLDVLMAREKSSGTAIGNGFAIPHPRYPVVLPGGESLIRVCYLEQPLDFQASDGKPVDTMFLMICSTVHEHLQLLARLACILQSEELKKLLRSRPDQTRLVSAVRAEEATFADGEELQTT